MYTSTVISLLCKYLDTVVELAVHVPESAWLYWQDCRRKNVFVYTKTCQVTRKSSSRVTSANPAHLIMWFMTFVTWLFLCYCFFTCSLTWSMPGKWLPSSLRLLISYLCLLCQKLLLFWMFSECTVHYLMCTFHYCVINKMFYDPGNDQFLVSFVSHYFVFESQMVHPHNEVM